MENRTDYKVLARYLNGECTPAEKLAVEEWFASLDTLRDDTRQLDFQKETELENKMLAEIKLRIAREEMPVSRYWFSMPLRVAAALLLLVVAGSTWVLLKKQTTPLSTFSADRSGEVISLYNNTEGVEEHRLPDGSVIRLQPHGMIVYASKFSAHKREVRLTGEAFFDVTKDKTRPFVINAHDVVVRVLGTSFNITAYENTPEVKVAVRTGRVSVTRPVGKTNLGGLNEVILTPNQEVIYDMVKEDFSKHLVETPQIILPKPTLFHMEYDAVPVDKIFEVLEANYGIDIVFDQAVLSTCSLTTKMEEEGFYERIEIICEAIGATFEVQDAKVYIKSVGCQELNN